MINDAVGTKCIVEGKIKDINALDNIVIDNEGAVYEVIRIIDNIPLFLEDHMNRMQNSIRLLGYNHKIDINKVTEYIKTTADTNNEAKCNVKIVFYNLYDITKALVYISKSYYPEEALYKKGVSLATLMLSRNNPNAKHLNENYRSTVSNMISKREVFEVLLVNDKTYITEGSRSNIFFIKDGVVYTPKKDMVLEGITRKHVFAVCHELGIEIKETLLSIDDISKFDCVFISGTSIHVLPVLNVDQHNFGSSDNSCFIQIRTAFNEMVNEYIRTAIS